MTPTRVFIVSPSPTVRSGLRSILVSQTGYDLEVSGVAEVLDPDSTLLEADVVLLSDDGGLEETALALSSDGTQALVVLSEDDGPVAILRMLPLLGWGVVSPDAPPEEMGAAISAAAQGFAVVPRTMTERLTPVPETAEALPEPLTAREREVLGLLSRGLSNRLIAGELHISEHTVKFHISSLYAKLGVGNRAEAVSQGARHGLISL